MSWPEKEDDRYFIYDATVNVWMDRTKYVQWTKERPMLKALVRFFRKNKFTVRMDVSMKKHYGAIYRNYYVGRHGDLQVRFNQSGMHTEINFFQDINHENQHGGRYDFDRESKMPYLVKLRYRWILQRLCRLLDDMSYRHVPPAPPRSQGLAWIIYQRDKDFKGRWAETGNREYIGDFTEGISRYNRTDGDGKLLTEGEFRCTRDYSGHLICGTVYYHLNNMWYLVAGGRLVVNNSCGDFFEWRPDLKRRDFRASTKKNRIDAALVKAVKAEEYNRAVIIKSARDRLKLAA